MYRAPEMSRRQFRAALERNKFRQVLLWISDASGVIPDTSWGIVMHSTGKTAYRATLAKVIRERRAEAEKRKMEHLLP